MLKIKNNIDDKMPIEDAIPVIITSAKLLVKITGTGASFGTFPSVGMKCINNITAKYLNVLAYTFPLKP